jgi:hypothetical protein
VGGGEEGYYPPASNSDPELTLAAKRKTLDY